VHGALEARRDGVQIGWMWPDNGPIVARSYGGDRVKLDDSLYFRLPVAWLEGDVTLRAFVYSHDPEYVWSKEPEWQDNFGEASVTFHPATPLTVHLVPLHLHRSYHPDDVERVYDPGGGGDDLAPVDLPVQRITAGLLRFHPIAELNVDHYLSQAMPLEHASGVEWISATATRRGPGDGHRAPDPRVVAGRARHHRQRDRLRRPDRLRLVCADHRRVGRRAARDAGARA